MKNIVLLVFLACILTDCSKVNNSVETNSGVEVTDLQLFQMALNSSKATFYKNTQDTIPGINNGAHPGNVLVWYNAKAATQLDAQGKVKSNPRFSDSSLIVKEIFNATTKEQTAIAILFKLSSASNAGAGGWIWSEVNNAGVPFSSASAANKGMGCTGCHTQGTFDYTLMNVSH